LRELERRAKSALKKAGESAEGYSAREAERRGLFCFGVLKFVALIFKTSSMRVTLTNETGGWGGCRVVAGTVWSVSKSRAGTPSLEDMRVCMKIEIISPCDV
jgi:hypothetical protein